MSLMETTTTVVITEQITKTNNKYETLHHLHSLLRPRNAYAGDLSKLKIKIIGKRTIKR